MELLSPRFDPNGMIPDHFTCTGRNTSPELIIKDIPQGTGSLALTVHDPDSRFGTWVHWVVYDLPVVTSLAEGMTGGTPGKNSFKRSGYGGPCPAIGTHRYVFTAYAVDDVLHLPPGLSMEELLQSLEGHVVGKAVLVGRYRKPPTPEPYREIRI